MDTQPQTAAPMVRDGGEESLRVERNADTRIIHRLDALFQPAEHAHGVSVLTGKKDARGKAGAKYTTVKKHVSETAWHRHLDGKHCLVPIPIRRDGNAGFGAIDVDQYPLDLEALVARVKEAKLPLVVCQSKSGGAHLFLFLREPVTAEIVRGELTVWAAALGYPGAEVFPKQAALSSTPDPTTGKLETGNGIAAPYRNSGKGVSLEYALSPDDGHGLELEEFLDLAEARRVDPADLGGIVPKKHYPPEVNGEAPPKKANGAASGFAAEGCDSALMSLGRSVLAKLPEGADPEAAVRAEIDAANVTGSKLHPKFADGPLPAKRIDKIVANVCKKEPGGKQSAATVLMDLLASVELWHDERCIAYATVPVAEHREHHPVKSGAFREWLARAFYEAKGRPPPKEALTAVLEQASARARFDGRQHATWVRVAEADGRIYLDLGDDDWRVIEVTSEGWRVLDGEPPVRFRRPGPTRALPLPERGGDIEELRALVNVRGDEDMVLLVGTLVSYLRPNVAQPILYAVGGMGSAKTSFLRLVTRLIDPRIPETPGAPLDEDDLVVAAQNRWLVAADNVTFIKGDMSDAYCRLATGGGLEKRRLYTDEEGHAIDVKRPVALTGIHIGTERPDFLDRTVLIALGPVGEDTRLLEDEVDAAVDAARPRILGALLDGVATALKNLAATKERLRGKLPRMADFAAWAEAAAPAFDWREGWFLEAYQASIADRLSDAAQSDGLVSLIAEWLPGMPDGRFDGGATDLRERLVNHLKSADREVALQEKWFPKNAVRLGRDLPTRHRVLAAAGVEYENEVRSGNHPAVHHLVSRLTGDIPF
ncbi:MAG: hypothetical protein WD270_13565 [Acetobacterales bacterium]